jgi:hypothetical protein
MSTSLAAAAFHEMLKFLEVVAEHPSPLSPSQPVDAAWHAFILHTRDYADYCAERFGSYLHHEPGATDVTGGINHTRVLIEARFGTVDGCCWPNASDCQGPDGVLTDCSGEGPGESVPARTGAQVALADCGGAH